MLKIEKKIFLASRIVKNLIWWFYYLISQRYRSSVLVYWFPYGLVITYTYFFIFYNYFNS